MTMKLEIQNELESYEVLKALIKRKENSHDSKEDLQNLIDQFEGYNSYRVLVEDS